MAEDQENRNEQEANRPSTLPSEQKFSVAQFIGDLDGGNFEQKLAASLKDVAAAVRNHESSKVKGKVDLTFTLSRIGESAQLTVQHRIAMKKPTKRGEKTENDTTETPMYSTVRGVMSIMPFNQHDWVGKKS